MDDSYNLQRFVDAQDPVYDQVRSELLQRQKSSHWMWFIFPQIRGLGHSHMARMFAISSLEEAEAYLEHPLLAQRLIECTTLVTRVTGRTIEQIFGYPDDLKFHSSMTLFAHTARNNHIFEDALQKYFGGEHDSATLNLLSGA